MSEDLYNVKTEYLLCRRSVAGHQWDILNDFGRRPGKYGWRVNKLCVRCGTELEVVWDVNGDIAARVYTYPEGYKIIGDLPVTSQDLRLEAVRRLRR